MDVDTIFPMEEDTGAGVSVFDTSVEREEDDYSGAPVTPRGPSGELEGDRTDKIEAMPLPEQQLFVVVAMGKPSPQEIVLRPLPNVAEATFSDRANAKLVAESQTRNNPETAFAVFGPYSSDREISEKAWFHPRSTPCDVYEMKEVVVRREYYPRGHKRAGQLKQTIKEYGCHHTDFGFVGLAKNVIEDPNAVVIPGSMLTSYLTSDGDLISPNVALMTRPPTKENMSDQEYASLYKKIQANQKDAVDALVDSEFRKFLPQLKEYNPSVDVVLPFRIIGHNNEFLFSGEQPVLAGKLPFAFAQILRTALTSFYGKAIGIHMPIADNCATFMFEAARELDN